LAGASRPDFHQVKMIKKPLKRAPAKSQLQENHFPKFPAPHVRRREKASLVLIAQHI
jgi:hypothetical protein